MQTATINTLHALEAMSVRAASLSSPQYKLAGESCCDQCCDDYVCSSD